MSAAMAMAPGGEGPSSSSRKRKAPDSNANTNDKNRPLVPATKEGLAEVRRRMATVIEETMRDGRATGGFADHTSEGKEKGDSAGSVGDRSAREVAKENVNTNAYVRQFAAAIMAKARSMCDVKDAEQQREADALMAEIIELNEDMQKTSARLNATRARVARLNLTTCADSLRVSKAAEDRAAAAALEAGATLGRAVAGGVAVADNALDTSGFSGLEAGVLEPKVSMLIGAIAELPGPLKAILQELPELTTSLSTTVQSVEAAVGVGESRTEALLDKAPPVPLGSKRGRGGRRIGGNHHPPREAARATAREMRVEQARMERAAGGNGRLGEIFGN